MRFKRLLVVAAAVPLSGCISALVPDTVRNDRVDFNEAIHETNDQLLLLNVIRVKKYESPVFTTVTERDTQSSAALGLTGGSSTIGSVLPLGILSGVITISQAPLDKIIVPYGADLINQYDSPITLQSFDHLYQADWPISSVIELAVQRLTPRFVDYERASDILMALDNFGAFDVTTTGEENLTITKRESGALSSQAKHSDGCYSDIPSSVFIASKWQELEEIFGQKGNQIVLSISSKDKKPGLKAGYTVAMRSGVGALKEAQHGVQFYASGYENIRNIITRSKIREGLFDNPGYYYLDLIEDPGIVKETLESEWSEQCSSLLAHYSSESAKKERDLRYQRAFLLIVESESRPSDAYISVKYRGLFYSILDDDAISKQNLTLLSTILTIEARPAANPTTQTVLAAGGVRP